MFYKFEKFLVVKVAERVQLMSREKCSGCVHGQLLDQLHDCMKVSLKDKLKMFLPCVKAEALERLNQLFSLYQQTAWVDDEHSHLEIGENLIKCLQVEDILDRRYINEDSTQEFPFNTSWLTDEFASMNNTLPPILPLDIEARRGEMNAVSPKKKRAKKN